jgi:SAM-dependent methyltransferase
MEKDMVKSWSAAAQSLALLEAAHEQGWMDLLASGCQVADLAGLAGMRADQTRSVVAAMAAIGVVETAGDEVRLTPAYAGLMSPDAPFSLADRLAEARMMRRLVSESPRHRASTPHDQDALVVADAYGLRPTGVARDLFGQMLASLPELTDAIRAGRYLDVGCGVAGFLLSNAQTFADLRGVGVELVPVVAAEAKRRAQSLGVTDRVEVRCVDARELTDEDEFDAAFWAQPFFAASTRPGTLAAIHRALRPGAALFMQEMERLPQDADEKMAFALRRLVFSGWDVPFAMSAEQLCAESEAAGFVLDRVAETPFGRIVVTRKPQ